MNFKLITLCALAAVSFQAHGCFKAVDSSDELQFILEDDDLKSCWPDELCKPSVDAKSPSHSGQSKKTMLNATQDIPYDIESFEQFISMAFTFQGKNEKELKETHECLAALQMKLQLAKTVKTIDAIAKPLTLHCAYKASSGKKINPCDKAKLQLLISISNRKMADKNWEIFEDNIVNDLGAQMAASAESKFHAENTAEILQDLISGVHDKTIECSTNLALVKK